jgi:hypothetical protein
VLRKGILISLTDISKRGNYIETTECSYLTVIQLYNYQREYLLRVMKNLDFEIAIEEHFYLTTLISKNKDMDGRLSNISL